MAALAGEADSFGIYAMPVPPLMFDEDGASKVMACAELEHPAHLGAGAERRHHGAGQHHAP